MDLFTPEMMWAFNRANSPSQNTHSPSPRDHRHHHGIAAAHDPLQGLAEGVGLLGTGVSSAPGVHAASLGVSNLALTPALPTSTD
eukprot:scaffold173300_cov14-Tisochrysis_lutea.AAC.1